MGDHFALLVDRLLTESTLVAVIESRNQMINSATLDANEIKIDCSSLDIESRKCSSTEKIVECRICQDEDEDSKMETPCSCCGSLKYAHRRCVQRWCNEKGDTICEICHQPFKPGYTAPSPVFQLGTIPMHFRGNWAITRRDIDNHRLIAMVSTDHNLLDPEYNNSASRNLFFCRAIALILMVLLVLRHTLPAITSGRQDFSLALFLVSHTIVEYRFSLVPSQDFSVHFLFLVNIFFACSREILSRPEFQETRERELMIIRISGLILPIYIVAKAVDALWRRYRPQAPSAITSDPSSDEEAGLPPLRVIRVH